MPAFLDPVPPNEIGYIEQYLDVADWPIIWCPDAVYHEQDNIRRTQGEPHRS